MIIRRENRSKSNSGGPPYVTVYDTETRASSCNCRGWTVKKEGKPRSCTHTRDLEAEYAAAVPTPPGFVPTISPVEAQACRDNSRQPAGVEPMLASAMTRGQRIEDYDEGWALEVKYDGVRILLRVASGAVDAHSRTGKPWGLPAQVQTAAAHLPDGLYDGELVLPEPGAMSSDVARLDRQDRLVLVLFDVLEVLGQGVTGLPYHDRRGLLEMAVAHVAAAGAPGVALAEMQPVSRAAVEAIWSAGGEGAILKRRLSRYVPGLRSPDWVKVKKQIAVTVTVLGFQTGDTGIAFGKTVVRDPRTGRTFTVKTLDTATIRAVAAAPEAFVGRRLVLHCNEVLPSGALRHPMWFGWDHMAGEAE